MNWNPNVRPPAAAIAVAASIAIGGFVLWWHSGAKPQRAVAQGGGPRYPLGRPESPHDMRFRPRKVVREFPAIDVTSPASQRKHIRTAKQAAQQLNDKELVLGVVVGGQARAYPINMLTGPVREIINDRLGGRAIAATW